jgi:hypothetical protein
MLYNGRVGVKDENVRNGYTKLERRRSCSQGIRISDWNNSWVIL